MPVYEYICKKGHEYERAESFSAPTEHKCIKCGAVARRQISMPTVIFKGSGFYSTDNRGSGPRSGDDSSSTSDATPAADTAPSDNGHSHGAGGHSHDTPSAPKVDASVD